MKQKQGRTKTIKNRVLFLMLFLVILQVLTIAGVILLTGTRERLDSSGIQILNNSVTTKGTALEEEMVKWSDLSGWIQDVEVITSQTEAKTGSPISENISSDEFRLELLEHLSGTVLENLRTKLTTGAFLILDDGTDSSVKDAVYLRDLNPEDTSESNHDILMEAGLGEDGFQKGFTLDINWSPNLVLGEERSFYDKPMQAASIYPQMQAQDLGYWSGAMRIVANDIQIITYTVPLLDSSHQPFGVIGVEISLDYLNNFLNGSEISIDEKASYFLGKSNAASSDALETVYVDGSYYKSKLGIGTKLKLLPEKKHSKLYGLAVDGRHTDDVCSISPIRLYNTNTPFAGEEWVVAGIVRESHIYEASQRLEFALGFALSVSLILGITGAFISTSLMFHPLMAMMQVLEKADPTKSQLPKTNIEEIDELANEIGRLRQNAFQAGSKVADIIDMSNLSLGIFEYKQTQEAVFCTKKLFELTELSLEGWSHNYLERSVFFGRLKEFGQKLSEALEENNIHYFTTSYGTRRYLEIKSVINPDEQLYIFTDVTSQLLEKEKIKHERDYDVLTNLYNRRAFVRIVSRIFLEQQLSTGVLSMWDLDNLKFVNDTYGHDMGDKYICLLADEFHKVDVADSVIARMSGDEFMLFFYNGNVEEMCCLLENIHSGFLKKKLLLPDGESLSVSASAGLAVYGQDADDYENLIRLADFAMYEVKNREKGGIRRFNRESYEKDYILVQGIGELAKIVKEERLHYVFQPIIDIRKKEIFAYEALMRPQSQILYNPELLLRVAEKHSQLNQIERLTWFLAISQFSRQKKPGCGQKLFLNSISSQCMADDEFAQLEALYGAYFPQLVMEVTESAKPDEEIEKKKEDRCKKHGMKLALDDYGAGYSTSALLMNSAFHYVKIDMSMVKSIHLSKEKQSFVKSVIQYCHQCNTKVIVEGVETLLEYQTVASLGTDYVQGYFLSRPVADITDLEIDFGKLLPGSQDETLPFTETFP